MLEGEIMWNHLPSYFNSGFACVALIGMLATSAGAQTPVLNWDRDTIVEKEYQATFCQNNPDKAAICSDAFSITQSGSQRVGIDSIYFKVTTPGIQSSQAMVRCNQSILYFAYHASGRYPWKVPEYNDPGSAKISIDPFQKVYFTGVEIDNCFYGCPVSQSAAQPKFLVTGVLIIVLANRQRDTLTVLGLQNQYDPAPIYRRPNPGVNKVYPEKPDVNRDANGRLVGSLPSIGSGNREIPFSCCNGKR